MAEFESLQNSLRQARAEAQAAARVAAGKSERARALELRARAVGRSHAKASHELTQAVAAHERAVQDSLAARKERDAQQARYGELSRAFLPFTDPRENVARLPDSSPFLLFPVRLETRFKTISRNDTTSNELWVRVFPDQCSIDTFDDLLSCSEVARAQNYWATVWAAGEPATPELEPFVRDKRVGAWRKLMGSFNAGRAHYVTTQYQPTNPADVPARNAETDVLPVIVSVGPAPATKNAIAAYWQAVIVAGGRPAAVALAFAALKAATGLGDAEARALVTQYVPEELTALLEGGAPAGDVRVTFLCFAEASDSKQNAWAHAAKVRSFPERFVLLGYQGNADAPKISAIGAPIPNPLIVGPDTQEEVEALLKQAFGDAAVDAMSDEEKAAKYVEYLTQQSETAWLFDFDRAVESGLGFRIALTPEQFRAGFTRLLVLGVQLGADARGGKAALEELFKHHQLGDAGFSFLRQGTPTNNTENDASGFSIHEDPAEAYARYSGETPPDLNPDSPVDGACLSRALGIDAELAALPTAQNYAHTDQLEAGAMQTALWHGTLGFFLESMAPALASEEVRGVVRQHFLKHVRGRGGLPSVRVGKQPYGVLLLSNLRNFRWATAREAPPRISRGTFSVLSTLFRAAMLARDDLHDVLAKVAHVGGSGDAHAMLLQVLGLHPSSVEYDRRIAESFAALRNTLLAEGFFFVQTEPLQQAYRRSGIELLERLGYVAPSDGLPPSFPIFERAFFQQQEDVKKPAIDDGPLSEERRLGPAALDGGNYIDWLVQKARTDHAAIRAQSGFAPGKTPQALLFDLLWHSVNLEFGEAGLGLMLKARVIDGLEASSLRLDKEFIGIQQRTRELESKWDIIYRVEPEVAPNTTIAAHISSLLAAKSTEGSVARLNEVLAALEQLARLPTARLERCFAEHLDACHYRLDAWLLSFVSAQLAAMRAAQKDNEEGARGGIYLGAYGWVENLKPKARELEPVELDAEQRATFDPLGTGSLVRDSANAGYVHAPSLAHGLTAAVLRNAYISAASADDAERYKVNLSSERVRAALGVIEGIQQGQGLAELLGYGLERGLHDRTELELDSFVYELRKVFPLASGRLASTAIRAGRVAKTASQATRFAEEELELGADDAAAKVEARNVVDGLALLERVATPGNGSYPFGFPIGTGPGQLRSANAAQVAAIDAEIERLKNVRDAVADLALAESVHQTVQGNYERAAGALDAFSKGAFPQLPDVIRSPASGLGLTHRFAVHFPAGVAPDAGQSPRSKAEPALNAWLKDLFPAAGALQCSVRFRPRPDPSAAPGAWSTFPVTFSALNLEPIDLLYLHDAESAKNLNALDDHVLRVFRSATPRRLDLEIEIDYLSAAAGQVSFFQLGALLNQLRTLVVAARPLGASDLALQNEGSKAKNATARVAPERLQKAKAELDTALGPLQTQVITPLGALVDANDASVGAAHVPPILAGIDLLLQAFLTRLGPLSRFGLEGAGTAFVGDRLRAIREKLCELVRTRAARWQERSERCAAIIDTELPAATTEEQRVQLWHQAETQVSTTFTGTFADSTALGVVVTSKRAFFEQKRTAAATFLGQGFTTLSQLFAAAAALLAGTETFDLAPLDVNEAIRLVVVLAEDLQRQATQLQARGTASALVVDALLVEAQTAPNGGLEQLNQAARQLFGDNFRLFPEFTLGSDAALELAQCLADKSQLLDYQTTLVGTDDPTEDWLYGVARVRDKLAAWEATVVLAEGFVERPSLSLTPLQLPYRPDDSWLGLAYPGDHVIDGDNLLYTAYAPGFDPQQPIVGALVDEWTETIPARQATTALTFHYDRPNCEAPQSLLLVTPAAMTGQWQWNDLVGSLHEALDLAQLRALEPDLLDGSQYAKLVPATVATMSVHTVTMAVNFALQQLATVHA